MNRCGFVECLLGLMAASRVRTFLFIRSAAVLSLIAFPPLLCGHAHAQRNKSATGELSGVVKGGDGTSIVLHLRSLDQNPVRYYDGYEEIATKTGVFHFADIAPGLYQLESETSGFTLVVPETITLHAGERRRGVVVSLRPSVSLCGRVTENGALKPNTWASAYRYNPEFGTLSYIPFPHTQADGSFTINDVTPGTYYLGGYTTYYPGSFVFNGAKAVVVTTDAPAGCTFDIPLQYTGCRATKVSGHITGVPGDSNTRYKVQFLATNSAGGSIAAPIAMNSNAVCKSGDTFTDSVCQGEYDLVLSDDKPIQTWSEFPSHKVVFDTEHLQIGATAIEGLTLTPRPMASIAGEVPGMGHNASCPGGGPRAHVSILREGDGQFQTVDLDDKNRFSFPNVAPGDYTIYVGPIIREAFYLASILVDGKPAEGRKFTIAQARPTSIVINVSGDLTNAAGHLSSDVRREPRWEVAWTRPKGVVEGNVLGVSGAGAMLKLLAVRYNSNAGAEYVAHAAQDGSFRFNAVDPGVYTLRAEGKDLVTTEYGAIDAGKHGTPIVIARNAHIQGLTLSPPRLSTICGSVVAQDGTPQAGNRIFLQSNRNGGVYGGPPGPDEALTGADGHFRIDGVLPGEYFLASPLDVNRIVFFSPDGTLAAADPVRVQAGKDVGCGANSALVLHMPLDYKSTYAFRGKVSGDLPPAVGDRFMVQLFDARASGARNFVATATLDAERRFSFDKVPGGRYLLQLPSAYGPEPTSWSGPYGPVTHLLASQPIDVQQSLTEVTITANQLPTVTGTVHFAHLPNAWKKNFDVGSQRITLIPRKYRAPFSAKLSADGTFGIGPEDEGDYKVDLNLGHSMFIQSVRLDGHEIKGLYFHLSGDNTPKLEIEVSGDSGQVNATIVPDSSLPLAEPPVRETCSKSVFPEYDLVLLPDPLFPVYADSGSMPEIIHGQRYSDTLGLIAFGVPPGSYRALMTERLPGGFQVGGNSKLSAEERVLWSALAALGKPVTVQAGATVELALPDNTVNVARLAAKLGISLGSPLLN